MPRKKNEQTQFKKLSIGVFVRKYDEANDALQDEDMNICTLPPRFGEVKVKGHGWCACVLNDRGIPAFFYDEDTGDWTSVPPFPANYFIEV